MKSLDLNFKIKRVKLKNYKLFSEEQLDMNDKLIKITGENGTGKTSLSESILVTLTYERINEFLKINERKIEIELDLEYNGNNYTILRTLRHNKIYKNGNPEYDSANGSKFIEVLWEVLPFCQYLKYFFLNESSSFFYNEFYYYVIGSDYTIELEYIEDRIKSYNSSINYNETKINEYKIKIDELNEILKEFKTYQPLKKYINSKTTVYKNRIKWHKYLINNVNSKLSFLSKKRDRLYEKKLDEMEKDLSRLSRNGLELILSENEVVYLFNNSIPYDLQSHGQRIISDLKLLINILNEANIKLGLLVLDDYLDNLSKTNYRILKELISNKNINNIIISSHKLPEIKSGKEIVLCQN
jgi:DNA repair exonuclease SbcCD ATPase subunit